jgi:uncharacterized membrane protein
MFSIKEVFKSAWGETLKNWKFLVLATLAYFGLAALFGSASNGRGFLSFIFSVCGSIVRVVFTIGMIRAALLIISGITPSADVFKTDWKTFWRFVWAGIITAFFTIIGLVLLIIPGIIVALRLNLTMYFLLDKKMSAWDSVKESWKTTKGHVSKLFLLVLAFIGVMIISIIPIGLGLLISLPFVTVVMAIVYRRLSEGIAEQSSFEHVEKIESTPSGGMTNV